MMDQCKICRSDLRKEIEKDLIRGVTYSKMREKYNISYPTFKRHKEKHLPIEIAISMGKRIPELNVPPVTPSEELPQINSLAECVAFIHNETLSIYKTAMIEKDHRIALQALKQDLECIGVAMRGKELTYSYHAQDNWEKMLPKILKAVEKNKEARIAIARAIYEHDDGKHVTVETQMTM